MRTEEEKGRKREEECGDERLGKVGPLFHEGEGDHPRVGGLRAAGSGSGIGKSKCWDEDECQKMRGRSCCSGLVRDRDLFGVSLARPMYDRVGLFFQSSPHCSPPIVSVSHLGWFGLRF